MNDHYAYLILSGGENRRMGGKNKLFLEVAGRRQLERLLSCIRKIDRDRPVYLSVKQGETASAYKTCGLPCIPDLVSGRGPLAGIASSLHYLDLQQRSCPENCHAANALLVLSSDLFGLEKEALLPLLDAYRRTGNAVFYEDIDGLPAPFPGVYTLDMGRLLQQELSLGHCRLKNVLTEWISFQKAEMISPTDAFFRLKNLNTPEDTTVAAATLAAAQKEKRNETDTETGEADSHQGGSPINE